MEIWLSRASSRVIKLTDILAHAKISSDNSQNAAQQVIDSTGAGLSKMPIA
jgi:hypothetical protein